MTTANHTTLFLDRRLRTPRASSSPRPVDRRSARAQARTRRLPVLLAGASAAALAPYATAGPVDLGGTVAATFSAGAAMALAAVAVTAADPDWAPGRSERVLRALAGAPLVVAVLWTAAALFGDGTVQRRQLALTVLLLAAVLVLVGVSPARRAPAPGQWSPPLTAAGGVRFPLLCRALKRTLDVVLGSLAIILTLPVLLVAAIAIKCDSKGPWLFRQTRLGVSGRPFTLLKLRTMRTNNDSSEHEKFVASLIRGEAAAADGAIFKLTADRRITRVGQVLRRLSLDELPQLFNVVRGSMSLVGPRPPLPGEAALYDDRARQRLAVKPGMTGLWQVSGRSRLTFAAMIDLDIRYWTHWTPLLELRVLARTPKVALLSKETA